MTKFLYSICIKTSHLFGAIANYFYTETIHEKRVANWNRADSKKNLRTNYVLNDHSIVIDAGGYKGDWASDIFSRYRSTLYVFEPVSEFYNEIKDRFIHNTQIKVIEAGLSNGEKEILINVDLNNSSLFKADGVKQRVKLIRAVDYFITHKIEHIDLLKINIEGGEYDLLEDIIQSGFIKNVQNIQVQFHDFVPHADERMEKIKRSLKTTHRATYEHEYVWENWTLKENEN